MAYSFSGHVKTVHTRHSSLHIAHNEWLQIWLYCWRQIWFNIFWWLWVFLLPGFFLWHILSLKLQDSWKFSQIFLLAQYDVLILWIILNHFSKENVQVSINYVVTRITLYMWFIEKISRFLAMM